MEFIVVHMDTDVNQTNVTVTLGTEDPQMVGPIPPCDTGCWDKAFPPYPATGSANVLEWDDPNGLNATFKIDNLDKVGDPVHIRVPTNEDLTKYKQNVGGGSQLIGIQVVNQTNFQMTVFLNIKIDCTLVPCSDRTPVLSSCYSSLDGEECVTFVEPGIAPYCGVVSSCTAFSDHYSLDSVKHICMLKQCRQRTVNASRGTELECGGEGCVKLGTTSACDVQQCPDFTENDDSGVVFTCRQLPCADRNPVRGRCLAYFDTADTKCGYLSDGPKCVTCDNDHLPGYIYDDGVCCASDHFGSVVGGVCKLKDCDQRQVNTSTKFLCGSNDCHYRPGTRDCGVSCAPGTEHDARGFCGPSAPVSVCPEPADPVYTFPCRDATCYLQPSGDACAPTCDTTQYVPYRGVCVPIECADRTYNPREETWPCGWPEENCFQDLGPDPTDPLQTDYTRCVTSNTPPSAPVSGCTDPFFETNSTEALQTGKCTRMPCEERVPQVVDKTAATPAYTCGDHCVYVPPRVVSAEDYDPNDIGRCIDEPPPPPPAKAKTPLTVKDYWWVFLLIALLVLAAISVVLFMFLWRIKKHHDAQLENDRDLMRRTAEDRERMSMNRKEGVKEEVNPELSEGGLIFANDAQEAGDNWMRDDCSDENVVDAVRCAPPFDIVHCDRRRTLFALYTELSANALASRDGDPASTLRNLLPDKLKDPLDPSMAVALVLRHLHQESPTGVGNITPHSLLVSTKGSLALVVKRDGLASQVDGAFENARWYAPEQKFDANSTHATDVYSLGLVMWQMASAMHEVPLAEVDSQSAFTRMAGSYRPNVRDIQSVSGSYDIQGYTQVIEACWVATDAERPTAAHVVDSLSGLTTAPASSADGW